MDTNKNQPDIDARIKEWKSAFILTSLTPCDTDELAEHLRDDYQNLLALGLNEQEAWMVASHRIGEPEIIKEEFKKVNQGFTMDRNWMMLLWGAVSVLILQAVFILIPLLYKNSITDFFNSTGETVFISKEYYSIGVIILSLIVLFIIRDGRLIRRFTNSMVKYSSLYAIVAIIAGLWAAFFSYMLFANYSKVDEGTAIGLKDDIRNSLSFLMFGFYFPLMAITGFSTMKYFSREMVSFKGFNKNINWKYAIILGLLAQAPVQFGNAFPGHSALKTGVVITVSILLFLIIGCMISYSKRPVFNLVCAQSPTMLVLLSSTTLDDNIKTVLVIIYLAKVLALAGGYLWSRQRLAAQSLLTT